MMTAIYGKHLTGFALLAGVLTLLLLVGATPAGAQRSRVSDTEPNPEYRNRNYYSTQASTEYSGRNVYSPAKALTAYIVRDELVRRMARRPHNDAVVWEVGNDFFRFYPRTRDIITIIKEGYFLTEIVMPDRAQVLRSAAIYWEKLHDHGYTIDQTGRRLRQEHDKAHYGDPANATSLDKWATATGGKRQDVINYEFAGRFINNRVGFQQSTATYGRFSNTRPEWKQ